MVPEGSRRRLLEGPSLLPLHLDFRRSEACRTLLAACAASRSGGAPTSEQLLRTSARQLKDVDRGILVQASLIPSTTQTKRFPSPSRTETRRICLSGTYGELSLQNSNLGDSRQANAVVFPAIALQIAESHHETASCCLFRGHAIACPVYGWRLVSYDSLLMPLRHRRTTMGQAPRVPRCHDIRARCFTRSLSDRRLCRLRALRVICPPSCLIRACLPGPPSRTH